MEIELSKQARKYLRKLHKPKRDQITAAIELLPKGVGDIRYVEGHKPLKRLKVDTYRVIFLKNRDIIKVEKIGPRGEIYKWL